jgi:DNA-binding NarL/FixJ family response regulator
MPDAPVTTRLRVLLADDHRLLIDGLKSLLSANGIDVVGVASDGLEAASLAQSLNPDLVLMDVRMPNCDGLEATRRIKARQPQMRIVMLTTSAEDHDLFEAVKSGACGYLLKSMGGDAFIDALRALEQGVPPFSPGLAARLLEEFARMSRPDGAVQPSHAAQPATSPPPAAEDRLTDRQVEVLRLVADGLTYREVGDRLALSERTVRFHMAEIISRLHLQNRSQVLAYAGKLGLTPSN